MNGESFRVSVEVLENGFSVEVPDMEARAKKVADAKKEKGRSPDYMPYMGDCTKKFAAKSVKEVLSLVKASLGQIPENEYDAAFAEVASASK